MSKLGVVMADSPSSTGTQDYTSSADFGGDTPNAVEYGYSSALAVDTAVVHAVCGMGMADGTLMAAKAGSSRTGRPATETLTHSDDDHLIEKRGPAAVTSVQVSATHSAFITNGHRPNFDVAGALNRCRLLCLLLKAANVKMFHSASGGDFDCGFNPDFIIAVSSGTDLADENDQVNMYFSRGFAAFDGAGVVTQGCIGFYEQDAQTVGSPVLIASQSKLIVFANDADNNYVTVSKISNGFNVVNPVGAVVQYLAVKLDAGERAAVTFHSLPTSTGNFNFQPSRDMRVKGAMALWTPLASFDSAMDDGTAGAFGFGFWSANTAGNLSFVIKDAVETTVTKSLASAKPCRMKNHDETDEFVADFVSMGWESNVLNFTDVLAAGGKAITLMFGDAPGTDVYGGSGMYGGSSVYG